MPVKINRTRALCYVAAAMMAVISGATSTEAQVVDHLAPDDPVATEHGRIVGKILDSGVKAYLGIPYAAPPVGALRWQPPQPAAAWKGTLNADRFAPQCIQVLRRRDLNHFFGEEPTSENCLYLNIWAPASAKQDGKLPVIVFIHGGGFTIGSGGMALYSGESVAREGAIFVNLNYRLGALGFLAHPELTAESPHKASGNYGLMDIVAALQWLKRNLAAFGGDPGNITVSGQSAGATAIAHLQVSPLGQGLFHRGVALSGSPFGSSTPIQTRAQAETAGLELQKAVGVKSLTELRQLAPDKILAVQQDCQLGCSGSVRVGPSVDGYFLPDEPARIFAAKKQADVPLILSLTRDESSNELRTAGSVKDYEAAARKVYGGRAEEFLRLYPASNDAEAKAAGIAAAREGMIGLRMRAWAQLQAEHGNAPVYMTMFSRMHPFKEGVAFYDNPKDIGVYHTADVLYWLQTQQALNMFRITRDWGEQDQNLAKTMTDSLLAFARNADPSVPGHAWPRWTPQAESLVEFGDEISSRPMPVERYNFHIAADATPRLARD
jgi:para-nitrobenzyl esterase